MFEEFVKKIEEKFYSDMRPGEEQKVEKFNTQYKKHDTKKETKQQTGGIFNFLNPFSATKAAPQINSDSDPDDSEENVHLKTEFVTPNTHKTPGQKTSYYQTT